MRSASRFLAATKQGTNFPTDVQSNFEKSWEITQKEVWQLLGRLFELQPHKTVETLSIFQARSLLLSLAEPIAHITKMLNKNMLRIERMKEEIESGNLNLRQLATRRTRKVLEVAIRELGYPRTVCTLCGFTLRGGHKEWRQICHEHCHLAGVKPTLTDEPLLQQCYAMKDGVCQKCSHEWRVHMHISYELYDKEVRTLEKTQKCQNVCSSWLTSGPKSGGERGLQRCSCNQ